METGSYSSCRAGHRISVNECFADLNQTTVVAPQVGSPFKRTGPRFATPKSMSYNTLSLPHLRPTTESHVGPGRYNPRVPAGRCHTFARTSERKRPVFYALQCEPAAPTKTRAQAKSATKGSVDVLERDRRHWIQSGSWQSTLDRPSFTQRAAVPEAPLKRWQPSSVAKPSPNFASTSERFVSIAAFTGQDARFKSLPDPVPSSIGPGSFTRSLVPTQEDLQKMKRQREGWDDRSVVRHLRIRRKDTTSQSTSSSTLNTSCPVSKKFVRERQREIDKEVAEKLRAEFEREVEMDVEARQHVD